MEMQSEQANDRMSRNFYSVSLQDSLSKVSEPVDSKGKINILHNPDIRIYIYTFQKYS